MFRWGRGSRQGRGCCVVVPIGRLMSGVPILVFSGLVVVRGLGS
jgi:hypothetical protein